MKATAIGLLALAGCLSPGAPPPLRYFTPPLPEADPAPDPAADPAPAAQRPVLALGPVTPGDTVEERWCWRMSAVEVAYDDLNRWAERPTVFLERALHRALYGSGAFAEAGRGATDVWRLDVHLDALEASRRQGAGAVRVRAQARARRGDRVHQQVFSIEVAGGVELDEIAVLTGTAVADLAARVRDWAAAELR